MHPKLSGGAPARRRLLRASSVRLLCAPSRITASSMTVHCTDQYCLPPGQEAGRRHGRCSFRGAVGATLQGGGSAMNRMLTGFCAVALSLGLLTACSETGTDRVGER